MIEITRPVTGVVNEYTGRTVFLVPAFIAPRDMTMQQLTERFGAAMRELYALGLDPSRIIFGELTEDPASLAEAYDNGRRAERIKIADELEGLATLAAGLSTHGRAYALLDIAIRLRKRGVR